MNQLPDPRDIALAILESSDDAVLSTTNEKIITSWNRAAERTFGYLASEALGQPISLIVPEERRVPEEVVFERVRRGEKVRRYESAWHAKDGHKLDLSISISPVRDEAGHVGGMSIVARDLASRGGDRSKRDLLEQAPTDDRAKAEFLALLAHELRNPLAAISSAAQVLAIARTAEERTLPQAVIQRQVAHLARTVDDMMDAARARSGDIVLDRRPVLMPEAIERALDLLKAGMAPAWHVIEVEADNVRVNADPVRLEQIILKLIGNAVKYTPAGRKIQIKAKAQGAQCVLTITDEGVGIGPDQLPRIFGLFVQGDWTADRVDGGLGIGLTLVRTLVELHGGSVEASSEGPGKGSTFTVRLPAVEGTEAQKAEDEAPPAPTNRRILIVEDNDDAREMLRVLLERQGHEVYEAADGAEGLKMALDLKPDLSFIDIGLPIVNGYEVARLIRESTDSGRLIALTGYGQPEDRQRSKGAGFDDHLVKPVAPGRLLDVLSKARSDEKVDKKATG